LRGHLAVPDRLAELKGVFAFPYIRSIYLTKTGNCQAISRALDRKRLLS